MVSEKGILRQCARTDRADLLEAVSSLGYLIEQTKDPAKIAGYVDQLNELKAKLYVNQPNELKANLTAAKKSREQ